MLGKEFNQTLEGVTLPDSLQSLTFGRDFNQSLEHVTLPSSLHSLTFGYNFDQSMEGNGGCVLANGSSKLDFW